MVELKLIKFTKEKGIDVLIVVDTIEEAKMQNVDTIIVLSGDADFVPAINLIKSYGVKTINLHTYSGSSLELRNACNKHILIDFDNNNMNLKFY